MYAARFALGLAEGGLWPVCNKYVGRWFARGEHGRIQAFWFNGAQIGIAIGLPFVTSILLFSGWRAVVLVCGVTLRHDRSAACFCGSRPMSRRIRAG